MKEIPRTYAATFLIMIMALPFCAVLADTGNSIAAREQDFEASWDGPQSSISTALQNAAQYADSISDYDPALGCTSMFPLSLLYPCTDPIVFVSGDLDFFGLMGTVICSFPGPDGYCAGNLVILEAICWQERGGGLQRLTYVAEKRFDVLKVNRPQR